MVASVVGSEEVTVGSGADPTGVSVTVPATTTAVYMLWSSYHGASSGTGLLTSTLDGDSEDGTPFEAGNVASNNAACGAVVWHSSITTGSQTLDLSFDAAATTGPSVVLYYIKDGDLTGTAWRDADADQQPGATAVSVTLTTTSDDLVLALDTKDSTPIPDAMGGSWVSDQDFTQNGQSSRASHIDATTTTQIVDAQTESYSSLVAISIAPASGSSILPKIMHHRQQQVNA